MAGSKKNKTLKKAKNDGYIAKSLITKNYGYIAKNYNYLLGHVKGIDDNLMKIHFKLYQGLVGATNGSLKLMKQNKNMVDYSSLQKQFSLFYNGMKLHELYFDTIKGTEKGQHTLYNPKSKLNELIVESFGSFDKWKQHFFFTGNIPGVGFVCLVKDNATNKLMNIWINEFNIGELIHTDILLVMDMWEHAYISQYGLNIADYQQAYLDNVNWEIVSKRL